ncbi:MAG: hypothetical protein HYY17_07570 [Planctomycetes bacterium]|nr:hypothetical protein [Planctomycetota bacterium]
MDGSDVFVILFYLLGLVGCSVLIVYQIPRQKRLRARVEEGQGLAALAASVGGRVERPSGRPELRFERQGRPCILREEMVGRSRKPLTTLEIRVATDGFLVAASRNSYRFPTIPPHSKSVSNPQDSLRITASDAAWAEGLLRSGLRALLVGLSGWAGDSVHVRLTTSCVWIEIETLLSPDKIGKLLEFGDRVVGLAGADAPAGAVEVLDTVEESGGICQVCSSPMDGAVVRCELCRTPHHADCWEYLGRCSTFGCPGARAG